MKSIKVGLLLSLAALSVAPNIEGHSGSSAGWGIGLGMLGLGTAIAASRNRRYYPAEREIVYVKPDGTEEVVVEEYVPRRYRRARGYRY